MGFLGGKKKNVKPDYTGLQLQTAVSTLPIPLLWGRQKMSGNLIWYNGFTAYQGKKGKGGKSHALSGIGGGNTAETDYRADIILALCEGPIENVGFTWQNQSLYNYQLLMFNLFNGGNGPAGEQAVWPWTEVFYSPQAVAYAGTAYMAAAWYQMGTTPEIGNLAFEVIGNMAGSGANGVDADPAPVIFDFLTNARYGAGFDPASIDQTTLFGAGGDASLQTYCKSLGIAFSPLVNSQEAASSILARWLQICNCAAVWTGGLLKFIPYGDTQTSVGDQQTFTRNFSIPYVVPPDSGLNWQLPAMITVASPDEFVSDGGVVYSENGFPLIFIGVVTITAFNYTLPSNTYGFDPLGTYVFSIFDAGKPVTITYTVRASTGFAPLLTPQYDLADADYLAEPDKDPISVDRADIYSLPGIQRIEVTSRSNAYAMTPIEARDQAQIEMYGPRVGSTITAHEICDEFTIGPTVAQLILQRALYVRAKYTWKLSWEFCLLDPMDVVTLTDLALGLDHASVRIVSIGEDDNGLLTVVAEELVSGIGTAAPNPSSGSSGPQHSFGQTAVSINTPLLYQPPTTLTGGTPQSLGGRLAARLRCLDAMGRLQHLRFTRRNDLRGGRDHHFSGRARGAVRPVADRHRRLRSDRHALGRSQHEQRRAGRRRPDFSFAWRHPVAGRQRARLVHRRDPDCNQRLQPDRPLPRHERQRASCARDRRALRAARQRGPRHLHHPGGDHGADDLFQVPELQRLRRRRADALRLHRLPDHHRQRWNLAPHRHPVADRLAGRPWRGQRSADHHSTTSAGSRTRWATSSTSATSASCRTRLRSSWRAASRSTSAPSSG